MSHLVVSYTVSSLGARPLALHDSSMWRDDPASVRPMLANPGNAPLDSTAFAYEPKYDGTRAIVAAAAPARQARPACASGRGWATRRRASFPRSRPPCSDGRATWTVRSSWAARSSRSTSAEHPRVFKTSRDACTRRRPSRMRPPVRSSRSIFSATATRYFAGVSTPVTWDEIEAVVSPKDFRIRSFAARLAAAGDLWAPLRQSPGADLRAMMKYTEQ